jgi:hypothetical protein
MAFLIALVLAIASFYGIFLFMGVIFDYFVFCPVFPHDMLGTFYEWWYPFAFLLVLGASWFFAGMSNNMFTVNGSGTKLYGKTPSQNGYIATKWICLFYFPILPVDSYEVLAEQNAGLQSSYAMNRLDEIYWPQILTTATKGFLAFLGIFVAFALILNLICFSAL